MVDITIKEDENAEKSTELGEEDKGGKENDGQEEDEEEEEEEKIDEVDDDFEPPTRKNPLSYIIDRKNKQIEKLKQKNQFEGENESGETDEEKKFFNKMDKVLENKFSPIFETIKSQNNETELKEFLSDSKNSHFKRYEKIAKKYTEHPAYAGVPVKNLFYMLDYENAAQRGAEKGEILKKKSAKNKIGGSSKRKESFVPNFSKMSDKEFQSIQDRVRRGEQIKIEEEE